MDNSADSIMETFVDEQVTLAAYTDQVRELIRHDRNDEAIAICKHILGHFPKCVDAYRQMGEAYLEKGDAESAKELFRRVLSADPENIFAYTGLSIVFERQQLIDEALWHLERAYELAPGNLELQKELLRLYNETGEKTRTRLKLTPGGLGRIYAQESLDAHALAEYRNIIATLPSRFDIRVALAETLWRLGNLNQATQVAQSILTQLPYCLKANLIIGAAWKQIGLTESDQYLSRAQQLDPSNQIAVRILGVDSPLQLQKPTLPRYVENAPAAPIQVTAMPDAQTRASESPLPGIERSHLVASNSASDPSSPQDQEIQTEISATALPPWLQTPFPAAPADAESTQESSAWLTELRHNVEPLADTASEEIVAPETTAALPDAPTPSEAAPPAQAGFPEWLVDSAAPAQPVETPSWIAEPSAAPAKISDEAVPSWFAELSKPTAAIEQPTTALPIEQPVEPAKIVDEAVPSWLANLQPPTETIEPATTGLPAEQPSEPAKVSVEAVPSWLADLQQPTETIEPATTTLPIEQPVEPAITEEAAPTWLAESAEPAQPLEQPLSAWMTEPPGKPTHIVVDSFPSWLAEHRVEPKPVETPTPSPVKPESGWGIPPTVTTSSPPIEPEPLTAEPTPPAPEPVPSAPSIVVELPEPKRAPKVKRAPKRNPNLALAREYRAADRLEDALKEYDEVVQRAPRLLNQVIDDLETWIQQRIDAPLETHRILGDAYTRVDRLNEALVEYRFVLDHTPRQK